MKISLLLLVALILSMLAFSQPEQEITITRSYGEITITRPLYRCGCMMPDEPGKCEWYWYFIIQTEPQEGGIYCRWKPEVLEPPCGDPDFWIDAWYNGDSVYGNYPQGQDQWLGYLLDFEFDSFLVEGEGICDLCGSIYETWFRFDQ